MRPFVLSLLLVLASTLGVATGQTGEEIDARVDALSRSLSCPGCDGTPLANHAFPLATDLKAVIKGLVEEGRSDLEIRKYLFDRYGDAMTLSELETVSDLSAEDIKSRTETVSKTLRCVVCQNQSIYDSNAPLAEDMRRLVQKRIEAGDSDEEAREYLRNLYGDYVLMSPPLQMNTILLWLGPALLVLLGGVWFLSRLRAAPTAPAAALTEDQRARVAEALAERDRSA